MPLFIRCKIPTCLLFAFVVQRPPLYLPTFFALITLIASTPSKRARNSRSSAFVGFSTPPPSAGPSPAATVPGSSDIKNAFAFPTSSASASDKVPSSARRLFDGPVSGAWSLASSSNANPSTTTTTCTGVRRATPVKLRFFSKPKPDAEDHNSELCSACGLTGELLCCDGCPRAFHLHCAQPMLSEIPEGDYFCSDQCESSGVVTSTPIKAAKPKIPATSARSPSKRPVKQEEEVDSDFEPPAGDSDPDAELEELDEMDLSDLDPSSDDAFNSDSDGSGSDGDYARVRLRGKASGTDRIRHRLHANAIREVAAEQARLHRDCIAWIGEPLEVSQVPQSVAAQVNKSSTPSKTKFYSSAWWGGANADPSKPKTESRTFSVGQVVYLRPRDDELPHVAQIMAFYTAGRRSITSLSSSKMFVGKWLYRPSNILPEVLLEMSRASGAPAPFELFDSSVLFSSPLDAIVAKVSVLPVLRPVSTTSSTTNSPFLASPAKPSRSARRWQRERSIRASRLSNAGISVSGDSQAAEFDPDAAFSSGQGGQLTDEGTDGYVCTRLFSQEAMTVIPLPDNALSQADSSLPWPPLFDDRYPDNALTAEREWLDSDSAKALRATRAAAVLPRKIGKGRASTSKTSASTPKKDAPSNTADSFGLAAMFPHDFAAATTGADADRVSASTLAEAKVALALSARPKELPCRTQELSSIKTAVEQAIRAGGASRALYISGVPGTGKTATVYQAVRELTLQASTGSLPPFQFVEVNGLKLSEPNALYSVLYEALTGVTAPARKAAELLDDRFSRPSPQGHVTVVLVDELDLLLTRSQSVLYSLFDWPSRPHAKLLVVAIANSMDLPERFLPKIESRLGFRRISFKPYGFQQLAQILTARLSGLGDLFDEDALEYAARVVAAVGDARRALAVARRAVQYAMDDGAEQVGLDHMERAVKERRQRPIMIAAGLTSPLEAAVLVAVAREAEFTGRAECAVSNIVERAQTALRVFGGPAAKEGRDGALRLAISRLAASRLLMADGPQRVRPSVALGELRTALETAGPGKHKQALDMLAG